jgi:hypothetical protein
MAEVMLLRKARSLITKYLKLTMGFEIALGISSFFMTYSVLNPAISVRMKTFSSAKIGKSFANTSLA